MTKGMSKAQMVEQFPSLQKQANRLDLMLFDVMNDRVTFGEWFHEVDDKGCKYRVGISRQQSYPLAMLVFRSSNKGQGDSIQVFDLEPWEHEVYQQRVRSEYFEPIYQALKSAKQAISERQAA